VLKLAPSALTRREAQGRFANRAQPYTASAST
jgi:hypothetical protein